MRDLNFPLPFNDTRKRDEAGYPGQRYGTAPFAELAAKVSLISARRGVSV